MKIWNYVKTNMERLWNKYGTNTKQIWSWHLHLLQWSHHSTRCQILRAWILREEKDCGGSENSIITIISIIITIIIYITIINSSNIIVIAITILSSWISSSSPLLSSLFIISSTNIDLGMSTFGEYLDWWKTQHLHWWTYNHHHASLVKLCKVLISQSSSNSGPIPIWFQFQSRHTFATTFLSQLFWG